jgi:hypothetical protein
MYESQPSVELGDQQLYFPPPPELEEAIYAYLVNYWVSNGIPQKQAEKAASIALEKLRADQSDETWCITVI